MRTIGTGKCLRISPAFPDNPWIICTLWLAEWKIRRATSEADLALTLDLLQWAAAHARPSGCLLEQIHPYTGGPLWVSPLTWSYAGVVQALLGNRDKRHALKVSPTCGDSLHS
jgi:GH15 family glucan-1,4-alpha-glucosidase